MNVFFRRANPEGDLGKAKSAVKVAKRRRETLTALEACLRSPKSWLKKRDVNENRRKSGED